jgi:hypothetical protein
MTPRAARSNRTPAPPRFLRLVMRLDQAGSAAFIVVALLAAPTLTWLAGFPTALRVVGMLLLGYAVALAALGVCMAYGLSRSLSRGEELPDQMWISLLMYRPAAPRAPRGGVTR